MKLYVSRQPAVNSSPRTVRMPAPIRRRLRLVRRICRLMKSSHIEVTSLFALAAKFGAIPFKLSVHSDANKKVIDEQCTSVLFSRVFATRKSRLLSSRHFHFCLLLIQIFSFQRFAHSSP